MASSNENAADAGRTRAPEADGSALASDDAELDRICLYNLLSACADRIYFKDRDSHFLRASASAAEGVGAAGPAEMIGRTVHDYFTPDEAAAAVRTERKIMRTGEASLDIEEIPIRTGRGDDVWLSTSKQPLRDFDGRIIGTFGISRDITSRKAAEQELVARTAELDRVGKELKTLIDSSPDPLVRVDAGLRCTYVNPAATRLAALSEQRMLGCTFAQLGFDAEFTAAWEGALREVLEQGEGVEREFSFPIGGREIYLHTRFVPEIAEAGAVHSILAVCRDLTDRRRMEQVLAEQAVRDPLTGLANRTLLVQRIRQEIELGAGYGLVALFLDLNRFKMVNDSLGHAAGDELLVAVAGRLREAVRRGDLVTRFGGDEFVILCRDVDGDAEAAVLAERVCAQFARPFEAGGKQIHVGTSIGIAFSEGASTTADALLRNADTAMYLAKDSGGISSSYRFFESAAHEKAVDRIDLEHELRHAAERGELAVLYQPVVDLSDGDRVVAAEALVRWRHPHRGLLPAPDFIDIAEETDLIIPIGRWVLDTACRQLAAWNAAQPAGGKPLTMAVNLSNRQLAHDPDLVDAVTAALARNDLAPQQLCLEVTETAAHDTSYTGRASLAALSAAGVRIALDDYGTGYSSLANLSEVPVDALKIDRTFVAGLGRRRGDHAIVVAIITLGQALGLEVIAEGVETAEQRERLRELGCGLGQGFLFAKPLDADRFLSLIR